MFERKLASVISMKLLVSVLMADNDWQSVISLQSLNVFTYYATE